MKYNYRVLILILVFFITLVLYNCKNKRIELLMNDNEWMGYRLADLVKGFIYYQERNNYNNFSNKFPNSIGAEYISKTKQLSDNKKHNNLKILDKICQTKIKKMGLQLPQEDELVVHIRLGDVLEDYKDGKFIFSNTNFEIQPEQYKKLFLKENETFSDKIKNIYILYGIHEIWGNRLKNINLKYLEEIRKILVGSGFNVIDKNSTNPDNDFLFMISSKHFVEGKGGFSKLISKLVKYNNGSTYQV